MHLITGVNHIRPSKKVWNNWRTTNVPCTDFPTSICILHVVGISQLGTPPHFLLVQNYKLVLQLYLYPSAANRTSSSVVPSDKICTPPGASFSAVSIKSLRNNKWYCLTCRTSSWPLRSISFAVLMLPNQALPLTPCLEFLQCWGIVSRSSP